MHMLPAAFRSVIGLLVSATCLPVCSVCCLLCFTGRCSVLVKVTPDLSDLFIGREGSHKHAVRCADRGHDAYTQTQSINKRHRKLSTSFCNICAGVARRSQGSYSTLPCTYGRGVSWRQHCAGAAASPDVHIRFVAMPPTGCQHCKASAATSSCFNELPCCT